MAVRTGAEAHGPLGPGERVRSDALSTEPYTEGGSAVRRTTISTTSPVLLLSFNRPDTTAKVLEALQRAQPRELFVFSDGPREGAEGEATKVQDTRAVIDEMVDWSPTVHYRYNENNQGLFAGVSGALDWFFSHVDEGIILEDDCVPHPDFFGYCDQLLEKYRDDDRVWCISGDNSVDLPISHGASYGFIRDPLIWGWATWARAWRHFDHELSGWPAIRASSTERQMYPDRVERRVRRKSFDHYFTSGIDAWGYKWKFTVQKNGGLVAVPRVNLVSNIGWNRPDATHTSGDSLRAAKATEAILPLVHPETVTLDKAADREWVESRGLGVKKYRWSYQLKKLLGRVRRFIGRRVGR